MLKGHGNGLLNKLFILLYPPKSLFEDSTRAGKLMPAMISLICFMRSGGYAIFDALPQRRKQTNEIMIPCKLGKRRGKESNQPR